MRSLFSMSFGWVIIACGGISLLFIFGNLAVWGPQRHPAQTRIYVANGKPERGATLIKQYGCGGCHAVPGVGGATGRVGPRLGGIGQQVYIGGVLANTADNMILWIRDPQSVSPNTAMPDLGVSEQDARDIAAYLYSLSNGANSE